MKTKAKAEKKNRINEPPEWNLDLFAKCRNLLFAKNVKCFELFSQAMRILLLVLLLFCFCGPPPSSIRFLLCVNEYVSVSEFCASEAIYIARLFATNNFKHCNSNHVVCQLSNRQCQQNGFEFAIPLQKCLTFKMASQSFGRDTVVCMMLLMMPLLIVPLLFRTYAFIDSYTLTHTYIQNIIHSTRMFTII